MRVVRVVGSVGCCLLAALSAGAQTVPQVVTPAIVTPAVPRAVGGYVDVGGGLAYLTAPRTCDCALRSLSAGGGVLLYERISVGARVEWRDVSGVDNRPLDRAFVSVVGETGIRLAGDRVALVGHLGPRFAKRRDGGWWGHSRSSGYFYGVEALVHPFGQRGDRDAFYVGGGVVSSVDYLREYGSDDTLYARLRTVLHGLRLRVGWSW